MKTNVFKEISKRIDSYKKEGIELQQKLISIRALGPTSGGEGEEEKAKFLRGWLKGIGIKDIVEIPAKDKSVPCGFRPNLVAAIGPKGKRTVWILAHLDVVPPGDLKFWETDPFQGVVKGGKIYGRGAEDNHQGLVSGLLALKAVLESGVKLAHRAGLVLVSDEETGSHFGLRHILKSKKKTFQTDDLFIVPDAGEPEGDKIEVAEKSILWLRFQVLGKQCHASTPEKGINAFVAGSALAVRLKEELHRAFPEQNPIFDPPGCTFEPTKKEANVPNVNTIPGEDVFYMDSRILPSYRIEDVKKKIARLASFVEKEYGVKVAFESVQEEQAAPPTPADAPVVVALKKAIREVYSIDAVPIGIGGGTVAAVFRKAGHPTAVWSKIEDMAHQPNEFCIIENMLGDAKVFAHVMTAGTE
jgi:succinyl-diaminopimelate desuccinylase